MMTDDKQAKEQIVEGWPSPENRRSADKRSGNTEQKVCQEQ
jgi:hypothetical protein